MKKKYGKKKAGRRRRYGRRRYRIQRYGASFKSPHRFVRWETTDRIIDLTGGATPNQVFDAYTFKLDNLQNSSEFTNLYDQFRIRGAKLYFMWSPHKGGGVVLDNTLAPSMMIYNDYDDNTPGTEGEFKSRANCRNIRLTANRTFTHYVKPAVLGAHYEASLATGYSPKWGLRIDCADSPTLHYGTKFFVRAIDGLNCGQVVVRIKYYIECFGQR